MPDKLPYHIIPAHGKHPAIMIHNGQTPLWVARRCDHQWSGIYGPFSTGGCPTRFCRRCGWWTQDADPAGELFRRNQDAEQKGVK